MHSTTSINWADLDLSALRRVGTEFHGPCPVTSTGTDGFWVNPDKRFIGCRHCSTNGGGLDAGQFTAHLAALGGAECAPPPLTTSKWTDVITGVTVEQTRTGQTDPKYLWPPRTKLANLVGLVRYEKETDRPIVWCEGAKAATEAARKLPADYDVVAFVSSSKIPSAAALETLATGRACIIWPDDDLPGAKVSQRLSAALAGVAASVRHITPARLKLTGVHGHDAEQWHPIGDPAAEFEAACGTATTERAPHFRSIWDYAETPVPRVLIPGLAWVGNVAKITAAAKVGKTSLLTDGIAAWQAQRDFLGEPTGPAGSVLYVSEMPLGILRAWLTRYGCPTDAPILAGATASTEAILTAAAASKPSLVVIDSLTDLFAASDGGTLWNAGDARTLTQPLRALGCAVILVHHVKKSDGQSRDSGDLQASPDMNITFDPGYAFGGDFPPPGPRRPPILRAVGGTDATSPVQPRGRLPPYSPIRRAGRRRRRRGDLHTEGRTATRPAGA